MHFEGQIPLKPSIFFVLLLSLQNGYFDDLCPQMLMVDGGKTFFGGVPHEHLQTILDGAVNLKKYIRRFVQICKGVSEERTL